MELQQYDELTFENNQTYRRKWNRILVCQRTQTILEYMEWRNFNQVIDKAKIACENSGKRVVANFVDVTKLYNLILEREKLQILNSLAMPAI